MRVGATIFNQNYGDWDRYEAEEQGKSVPARAARSDRDIFNEEIGIARIADETGFNSVWTIEHHFTPYTMVTNPLQYLTYIAGITKKVDLGTMVTVLQEFRMGKLVSAWETVTGRNPKQAIIENLRHFKAFAETGEIPRTTGQPHGERGAVSKMKRSLYGEIEVPEGANRLAS